MVYRLLGEPANHLQTKQGFVSEPDYHSRLKISDKQMLDRLAYLIPYEINIYETNPF